MEISGRRLFSRGLVLLAGLGFTAPTVAQTAATEPFRGKTLSIVFGASAGGALDLQAQLLSRHLGDHIPGKPNIVVSSMPGAVAVLPRHLQNVAPKDGTTIGLFFSSVLVQPQLRDEKDSSYDANKFSYLGSSFADVPACMASKSAPVATPADILRNELIVGALPPGTTGGDFTTLIAGLLGAKFRLIRGYPGFQGEAFALEKGELQVVCVSWGAMKARYPDILSGKTDFRVFLRGDAGDDSELAKAGIAPLASLAASDLDRRALEFFMSQFEIASPFALPPNVPAATVEMLRKAFAETMADPAYLADAAKMKIDVSFASAERVREILDRINRAPPEVTGRVKKALAFGQ